MKILIFTQIDSFITGIVKHLEKTHEVELIKTSSGQQIPQYIESTQPDLVWFEFCDRLIVEALSHSRLNTQTICRIHSYELFTPVIHNVNWDYVDDLIFVSTHTKRLFEANVGQVKTNLHVIHNGIDFTKFSNTKPHYGKNLAYVGYLNHKKNIPLLLYCFEMISKWDPEYTLHIAGAFQESRLKLYFDHFCSSNPGLDIKFDGWVKDVPLWLSDKDYIFSTSLFESFHYGAMEGIAQRLLPLIHNWYGADTLYPVNCLFNTPVDCLNLIKTYEKLTFTEKCDISNIFRSEIKQYGNYYQYKKIDKLIGAK